MYQNYNASMSPVERGYLNFSLTGNFLYIFTEQFYFSTFTSRIRLLGNCSTLSFYEYIPNKERMMKMLASTQGLTSGQGNELFGAE